MTKNCEVLYLEDFRHPKVGEFSFSARYGLRKVSSISACGWWYSYGGARESVNRPSVRKPTKKEMDSIEDSMK